MKIRRLLASTTLIASFVAAPGHAAFIGVVGNNSIDGSLCVGFDCIANESFGFDTVRLKENNLRQHFQDTSTSASFPSNDWRIIINDSSNGGANYFGVEDSSAGRIPFRVEAAAPNHALYVDDGGRVGFGTNIPVADLHVKDGDSPTLRLEQDGTSGFSPQIWDLAGNETNFFVRDVTNGSTLPFRIEPGTASSTLYLDSGERVGINTASPDGVLDVSFGGTIHMLVEDGGDVGIGTATPANPLEIQRTTGTLTNMLWLENNEGVSVRLIDSSATGENWALQNNNGTARLISPAGAGTEFELDTGGNLEISGTLTENSDKNSKMAIVPLDTAEILEKVMELPLSAWTYIHDAEDGTRHIGPMAQDFYALFGTGKDETGISTIDTSGVALAAIQALEAKNAALLARLDALEAKLATAE